MDQDLITFYKLQLAHDLITFLVGLNLHGLSTESKSEKANMILEAWEKRIIDKVGQLRAQQVKDIAEATGVDEDVQSILAQVHSIEPDTIRKEFKIEARHAILRSFES